MTQTVEMKEYDLIGILNDEQDALESFTGQSDDSYVSDAISQIGDDYIPIYNNDVWENASAIQDYIEEAIENGLAPTEGNVDLIKTFQAGYYQYYTSSLYQNLDIIAYNMVAEKVNEELGKMDETLVDSIDMGNLEEEIETQTKNFDNNEQISKIDDIVESIVERIQLEEFTLM